jgi:hypothetical protein
VSVLDLTSLGRVKLDAKLNGAAAARGARLASPRSQKTMRPPPGVSWQKSEPAPPSRLLSAPAPAKSSSLPLPPMT